MCIIIKCYIRCVRSCIQNIEIKVSTNLSVHVLKQKKQPVYKGQNILNDKKRQTKSHQNRFSSSWIITKFKGPYLQSYLLFVAQILWMFMFIDSFRYFCTEKSFTCQNVMKNRRNFGPQFSLILFTNKYSYRVRHV